MNETNEEKWSKALGELPPLTTAEVLDGYAESERGDSSLLDPDFCEKHAREAAQRWYDAEIRKAKSDAINELNDHLHKPGVLWHGDSGVTVHEPGWERRWPEKALPLGEWLSKYADNFEENAS